MTDRPAITPPSPERLETIDALRGWAILAVIVAHAGYMARADGALRWIADQGSLGVQLFFMISGFTIFLTLDRAKPDRRVESFYIRRLMRIVPVYWLGIALYTAVYGMGWRGWQAAPEAWHYPLHATLTNLLHPATMSSVVPGGWSISCEVLFYLTVPLWFAIAQTWRPALLLLALSLVVADPVVDGLRTVIDGRFPQNLDQYWYRSFPNQLPFFLMGILILRTRDRPAAALLAKPAVWRAALVVAALAFGFGATNGDHHLAGGALALGVAAFLQRPAWPVVNAATVSLGRISYSAYLFHFVVLEKVHSALGLGFAALLAVSLPLTVTLAYLGFRFVEQPAARLAGRIVRWRRTNKRGGGLAYPALRTNTVPAE